jgi:hypothetical protein
MSSPLQPEMQAQMGRKKKTHRGRRSRGKGPTSHHADAKTHLANAHAAPTAGAAMSHLFKAVRSMHKARQDETAESENAVL